MAPSLKRKEKKKKPVPPLDAQQLRRFFKRNRVTEKYFLGVFSRGDLPEEIPRRKCFAVLNSDRFDRKGIHWVLVYYNPGETVFFCSFGNTPDIYNFDLIVQNKFFPVVTNIQQVQSTASAVCGYHVCVLAHFLSLNHDLTTILARFYTLRNTRNDSSAVDFALKANGGVPL
jgi:hypothetical protein